MSKKFIAIALASLLSASAIMAQPKQVMLDKVVAVVGNSSVLNSQVNQYAQQIVDQRRAQGYTTDRDPRNEALEALMTQKLLYNQALLDSVVININDISNQVNDQVDQMVIEEGSIVKLEAKYHMPIYTIRENMIQLYEEQSYAGQMQAEVVNKVTITPGEVERYYKSISRDSLPLIPEQYVYAQITRFPQNMKEAKQRTKERLISMRQRIISGEATFANLARMYSVCPSSMHGGELDAQPLQGFVKPFADALENLQLGQISEVVESEMGFHIIELLEKKGTLYRSRHILLRPTYSQVELNESTLFLDSIANLIRQDSITFEKAAFDYSDDKYSKKNGGIVSNQDVMESQRMYDAKLTQTKFLKEDFGQLGFKSMHDLMALEKLEVGEVSDAYPTEDQFTQLSKIVKLIEIIPAHKASLSEDYIRLEAMALNEKKKKYFREWLDKKIDAMYIHIAPELRDGEFESKHWLK